MSEPMEQPVTDDFAASAAARELTAFITEIDTEFRTWRASDLGRRWGNPDRLPLYPTDASLPTTTVGTVRALLLDYKHAAQENRQLHEEVARCRITLRHIVVQLVVSVVLATVIWTACALLLGASGQLYAAMISVALGSAFGQGWIWKGQRRTGDRG